MGELNKFPVLNNNGLRNIDNAHQSLKTKAIEVDSEVLKALLFGRGVNFLTHSIFDRFHIM